ncbi:MAG: cytochrome bc1 complex diheme cytochrome c subunit [Acidimicrobiales bacterium]
MPRLALPAAVVLGVGLGAILALGPAAASSAAQASHHASKNLASYGDSAITYYYPPASYIPAGEALFGTFCSSCHGVRAEGTSRAPNLVGLGPATVHFWVSTGRMPAEDPTAVQAPPKPARLSNLQALQVAAYVNSLDPARPAIPLVHMNGANVNKGAELFALNCAACHTITGAGDALAFSTFAPSLRFATATQIAEAVRTGPANMPRFSGNLTDAQVRDVTAYVTRYVQHPTNPGGFGLGGIGPVAEGFVALLFGVGVLFLIGYWIGERS